MHNTNKIKGIIGLIAFIGITLTYIWGIKLFTPKPKQPTEGIPHNYYHPDIWEEDTTERSCSPYVGGKYLD
tara:strand:- start:143 stop:355 length:213 start_codon:yes stop_codon:yes gene_type:complete